MHDEINAIGAMGLLGDQVLVQVVQYILQFTIPTEVEGGECTGDTVVHSGLYHVFIAHKEHGGHDHRVADTQGGG